MFYKEYNPFPSYEQPYRKSPANVANYDYRASQADWSERDPRQTSYILNKPPFVLSVNKRTADPEHNFEVFLRPSDLNIHELQNDEIFEIVDAVFKITEEVLP